MTKEETDKMKALESENKKLKASETKALKSLDEASKELSSAEESVKALESENKKLIEEAEFLKSKLSTVGVNPNDPEVEPDETPLSLFDPSAGAKTPAVIDWRRQNWSPERFKAAYPNL